MTPAEAVETWVRDFVVHHDLCPFAGAPLRSGRVRFVEARAEEPNEALADLLTELERLDEDVADTTLLVLPRFFDDFDDFLDLVAASEALLEATERDGDYQLASFHPHYRFEGAPKDDPANATNQAPFPALHLLRTDSVALAIEQHPDTEAIPQRNIDLLRALAGSE
jgi:uncharacterized protein